MNVTFQQAVMLKELGFNWKVNHGYSRKLHLEPDYSFGNPKGVHSKDPKNYNDNRKGAGKGIQFFSAPRLDQAAAWLREKKIEIVVEPRFYKGRNVGYEWGVYDDFSGNYARHSSQPFSNSYDVTLSAGIDEALEILIKKIYGYDINTPTE